MNSIFAAIRIAGIVIFVSLGCTPAPSGGGTAGSGGQDGDAPVAEGVSAALGQPIPTLTAEQQSTFERGLAVMQKRFDLANGLGPAFNVTFCGGCHEKPVTGGSSGLYRNFFLAGRVTVDGAFLFADSAGDAGGVMRMFNYDLGTSARPEIADSTTIFAQRNAIPIFGVGLLAELSDDEILSRADPDDDNNDGISGRANFDRGFVGRFGRKSQTVSIEAFIRGPLFNHMGITTDPLTEDQRARLPVDSAAASSGKSAAKIAAPQPGKLGPHMQAAAPDGPTTDNDGVADPEMSGDELFDLISFVMLLAAPEFDAPTEASERGRLLFRETGCDGCHTPRLQGPRGPIGPYSDLLVHDMGENLADGIVMKDATGSEFRTQPLWGIAATGPYLHDGRAETIPDAILAHGGEAQDSRNAFAALSENDRSDVLDFLLSLGGRSQATPGLLPLDADVPESGAYGGPRRTLEGAEQDQFIRGREVFDRDLGLTSGIGFPRYNADSCRACHFDPVIGGAGPRGVNVMRHGITNDNGEFVTPSAGTILHKETADLDGAVIAQREVDIFEHRQTPHLFGLGLVELVSDETILANADPTDSDADGISGRVSITDGGRLGRFGWKAQVPSVAEFVRDAMAAELGITVELQPGLTFGRVDDNDAVVDPELSTADAEDLAFFIGMLAPPPRQPIDDTALVETGEALFGAVGCTRCHVPDMDDARGLYSDLLLHEILAPGMLGIEDTSANMREFRTAPLWGLSQTAPYFHDGAADTIDEAIRMHDGESAAIRNAYVDLSETDRLALLAFLDSL